MSKERELLKKALDFMLDAGANLNPLFKEINDNLLDQPEQSTDSLQLDDEVHEEPPTPDGNPDVYTLSPMTHREAYLRGYEKAVCALKREPLSDEEVIAKYRAITLYAPSYYAGFRDAEKAHGIGGGE